MLVIELFDLPMPPSSNRLNVNRAGPGPGRRRSDEYVAYLAEAEAWRLSHLPAVRSARAVLQERLRADPWLKLRIEIRFRFNRGAILCHDGRPKRNDTENRLKALLDAVASVLGIDDKLFWAGSFDKEALPDGIRQQSVVVRITPYLRQAPI